MAIHGITFNPFQENMFIISDDDEKTCVIIDPGCYERSERDYLEAFIKSEGITPVRLLNTHCHLDHIFGNAFVARTWNLELECHELDLPTLALGPRSCEIYGFKDYDESLQPSKFLKEGQQISFGSTVLDIIFVPGHAPGHVAFINHAEKYIVNGDCLFQGSIGRTDLPGGDYNTLEKSIKEKLYSLPDDYIVYSGHGPETTIGHEKKFNAFVRAD